MKNAANPFDKGGTKEEGREGKRKKTKRKSKRMAKGR
jgi:hypothetical protein